MWNSFARRVRERSPSNESHRSVKPSKNSPLRSEKTTKSANSRCRYPAAVTQWTDATSGAPQGMNYGSSLRGLSTSILRRLCSGRNTPWCETNGFRWVTEVVGRPVSHPARIRLPGDLASWIHFGPFVERSQAPAPRSAYSGTNRIAHLPDENHASGACADKEHPVASNSCHNGPSGRPLRQEELDSQPFAIPAHIRLEALTNQYPTTHFKGPSA
jgi:hypothetical protein